MWGNTKYWVAVIRLIVLGCNTRGRCKVGVKKSVWMQVYTCVGVWMLGLRLKLGLCLGNVLGSVCQVFVCVTLLGLGLRKGLG